MREWLVEDPNRAIAWLKDRRWYGDKSQSIAQLDATELVALQIDDVLVSLLLIDLTFNDGGQATYFLPAIDQEGTMVDASGDNRFLRWLADGFATDRYIELPTGHSLSWSRVGQEKLDPWWTYPPEVLTGEQSNTSVRFGDQAVTKVFRKWQPGLNPDAEIVEFITTHTTFRHVPAYLGSIRLVPPGDDAPIDVVSVQTFVRNQGDCWQWLPPALASANDDEMMTLVEAVGLLGLRTGELHAALASGTSPAFAPEALDEGDVTGLRQRVESEVRETCRMLAESGRVQAAESAILEQGLLARLGETGALTGSARTRVHGDYHLGQVLRASGDFVIIDFEGEPSRSMVERRQKHSPLKDVAGMLRSLDYAAAAASEGSNAKQQQRIREFGVPAREAFMDGYRQGLVGAPGGLLPTDPEAFDAALDLFMIEKALYETRYELDNRPDWLSIPLGALRTIAYGAGVSGSREQ